MAHLIDYVAWRGDLPMSDYPLVISDILTLSQLTYCSFPADRCPVSVHDWLLTQEDTLEVKGLTDEASSLAFAHACACSRRFGELLVDSFQEAFDSQSGLQFAACTYVLPEGTRLIAYRGTDQTIAGWKEDFMISFTKVRSQEYALTYLEDEIRCHPDTPILVAGHSKGGNLALYACAYLSEDDRKHIQRAFLLDGPGFCPEILDISRIQNIDSICTRIIPGYSIIGQLFFPQISDTRIVQSTQSTIMQHDMMSWCITPDGLDLLDSPDPASTYLNEALDSWIRSVSLEDRKTLVERLFDPMMEDGTETLDQFASKGIVGFENVVYHVIGIRSPVLKTAMGLPEHAIFGDIPEKIRTSEPAVSLWKRIPLLDGLMIFTGILCHLLPGHFMDLLTTLAIVVITCGQIVVSVQKLYTSHWNFRQEQPVLSITMLLLSLSLIIFAKENALFLLSSAIFGIGFLLNATMRSAEIREAPKGWIRLGHVFEAIISILLGGFILVAPQHTTLWYIHACGHFLIFDGLFRLLSHKRRSAEKQRRKKAFS